ncbi:MAG: hypothetical protein LZF62_330008 [Nitrospira sp.]|nr:MAG: hypothetical protein LZF62_330008 [Nitrospira sp.]
MYSFEPTLGAHSVTVSSKLDIYGSFIRYIFRDHTSAVGVALHSRRLGRPLQLGGLLASF